MAFLCSVKQITLWHALCMGHQEGPERFSSRYYFVSIDNFWETKENFSADRNCLHLTKMKRYRPCITLKRTIWACLPKREEKRGSFGRALDLNTTVPVLRFFENSLLSSKYNTNSYFYDSACWGKEHWNVVLLLFAQIERSFDNIVWTGCQLSDGCLVSSSDLICDSPRPSSTLIYATTQPSMGALSQGVFWRCAYFYDMCNATSRCGESATGNQTPNHLRKHSCVFR